MWAHAKSYVMVVATFKHHLMLSFNHTDVAPCCVRSTFGQYNSVMHPNRVYAYSG